MATKYNYDDYDEWLKPYLTMIKHPRKGYKDICKITKEIPFEIAVKNNLIDSSRAIVVGNCKVCGKKFKQMWRLLSRRIYSGKKEICPDCALNYATNTKEWKKKNSEAQLIAQNRPETIEKRNKAVRESKTEDVRKRTSETMREKWKDKQYVENQREAHLEAMRKVFENPETCYKMTHKNRFYTGWYGSKFGKIYFGSSWELAFIVWCEKNSNIINMERCTDWIEYKDSKNKKRKYNPDFLVWTKSDNYVVEIKGRLDVNKLVELKSEAAKKYYKGSSYNIYYKEDLVRMGIMKSNHKAKLFCEQYKDKIYNLNEGGLLNGKSKINKKKNL